MINWNPIRRNVSAGFVAFGLMLFTLNAAALTNVSGAISSDTTWDVVGSPYILSGAVTVNAGSTLTLTPGVVVKGWGTSAKLVVNGTLIADGTSSLPIVFTSYKDDSYGGDSNGDDNASSPAGSDWIGIGFDAGSTGNVVDNVVLWYAGYIYSTSLNNFGQSTALYTASSDLTISDSNINTSGTGTSAIYVDNAAPVITGSVVAESNYGIRIVNSNATITGNTIQNNSYGIIAYSSSNPSITGNTLTGNGDYAIYIDTSSANATVSNNTITGSVHNGIYLSAGALAENVTWSSDTTYLLGGAVTVNAGSTLTLTPGVVVKGWDRYAKLVVNGTLIADGTSSLPIVFTSYKDDSYGGDSNGDDNASSPAGSDWIGIGFDAGSTGNVVDNVVLWYAGYIYSTSLNNFGQSTALYTASSDLTISDSNINTSGTGTSAIYVDNAAPVITGSVVAESNYGIRIVNSNATITGNTIQNNSYGIIAYSSSNPSITGNTLTGNGDYAIYIDTSSANATVSNNTITGSVHNGIYLSAGALAENVTWSSDTTYLLGGAVTVNAGSTLTLTPGVVVKGWDRYAKLVVNGTLIADGTSSLPIVFTSYKDDSYGGDSNGDDNASSPAGSDWIGIGFDAGSTGNVVDNVVLWYAGYIYSTSLNNFGQSTALYTASSDLTISDSNINTSGTGTSAIYVDNAAPVITGSVVAESNYGIRIVNSNATITGNTIQNNSYGIIAYSSSNPSITGNTLTGNGDYAIYIDTSSANATVSNNTITGSVHNGIYLSAGALAENVTWSSDTTYLLGGAVTVNAGSTLTLTPGVVVKGWGTSAKLVVNGTLIADGTSSLPIVFTSYKDDSYGGDSNGDDNASSPAGSDWIGIGFDAGSTGNVVDNVVLWYAGYIYSTSLNNFGQSTALYTASSDLTISDSNINTSGTGTSAIYVDNAAPVITGSVVAESNYGIRIVNSNATITGNTIQNNSYGIIAYSSSNPSITGNTLTGNGDYAIYIDTSSANATVSNNTITGSVHNGIYLSAGALAENVTWSSDTTYLLGGAVTVNAGSTLTLTPGVVVKGWDRYAKLVVNGTLIADGTSSLPIVFTSYKDDSYGGDSNGDDNASSPAGSDWIGIGFDAGSTGNVVDNVVLWYAGYIYSTSLNNFGQSTALYTASSDLTISDSNINTSGTGTSAIYVDNAAPVITGSVVAESNYGIRIVNSNATITGNTIQNNSYGIIAYSSSNPSITGNTLTGNGDYAIYIDTSSANATVSNNTITGSVHNGIYLSAGALAENVTWSSDTTYLLGGAVTVNAGSALTLTPGVVVKGWGTSAKLVVNGTLIADGTSSLPIVFTSYKDDSYGGDSNGDDNASSPAGSDWIGIGFDAGSTGNVVDNVVLWYAGYIYSTSLNNFGRSAALYTASSDLTISDSNINTSGTGTSAIYVDNAAPVITGSVVAESTYGILLVNSNATITGNTIQNNTTGIYAYSGSNPAIIDNTLIGNGNFGFFNGTSSVDIAANSNYWGSSNGPYDPSDDTLTGGDYNPAGTGDKVSDYVAYRPWLTYNPNPVVDTPFSGYVFDTATNLPISDAFVRFGTFGAYTDSNGRYGFTHLPTNTYDVIVTQFGYHTYSTTINITGKTTFSFVLTPDPAVCTGGVLSGAVIDKQTSMLKDGVDVELLGQSVVQTAGGGAFSFGNLPAGTYTLKVTHGNYVPFEQKVTVCNDTGQVIQLITEDVANGIETITTIYGDPVNTATGNYVYQHRDIEIPGIGMSFVFERSYNSRDASLGPLGYNWTHNWNASTDIDVDGNVTVRWGDGHTETWAPDGGGGFLPQFGVFDTLIDDGGGAYTVKKKNLSTYHFDVSKKLSSVADRNGNAITLIYTGSNLTQFTDTAGRVITLTYDTSNRITQIIDPVSRTIEFDYDVAGDLVTARDARGNSTQYTYDGNHQILTVKNPRGFTVVTNTYDATDRVVTHQSDAKLGGTQYVYEPVARMTTITDAENNVSVHYFDALLRLIREVDANGNELVFVYDDAGNRTQVTDKNGNLTEYVYDLNGNVIEKIDALSNKTTITYDANNNPLSRTDALGNTTLFTYDASSINLIETEDALGNITTISYLANGTGLPEVITDARLHTTTNTYDTNGTLLEVKDHLNNSTVYTYDGVGRRLTTRDANLHLTTFVYNNNDNLVNVIDPNLDEVNYTYDENNNRKTTFDKKGNLTQFTYDEKDLLDITTDALLQTTQNGYDGLDRRISFKDKRNFITQFEYDAVGRLTKAIDPLLQETTTTYDPQGNLLSVTDANINTIMFTYDVLNRQKSSTDPENNTTTSSFDKLGRVTSTTDASGKITVFEYDVLGRLINVADAEGGTVGYGYDENGNRSSVTDPNGNNTSYTYDELDRLMRKDEQEGSVMHYEYDAVGNLTKLTKPDGTIIDYTYDNLNRLETVTYPDTSTVTFSYDKNGNRTHMTDSLGTQNWVYDALDRVTSHTDPYGNTIAYGYDENGNRTSLIYPDLKVVDYTYDALNRLTDVTDWLSRNTHYDYDPASRLLLTTLANDTTEQYGYDMADRLISLENRKSDNGVISTYAYTIDAVGNHKAEVRDEPLMPLLLPGVVNYSHDTENRLTHIDGVPNSFDANGNLASQSGVTYTWDYQDRLLSQDDGVVLTTYDYDGLGERFQRTVDGTTTRFVLDTNTSLTNVLVEADASNNITAYNLYGLGLIARIQPAGTASYYHYDSRGSTIALTDDSGATTDTYAYDPFGKPANRTGSTANPFTYIGRHGVLDEGDDLFYIRARYYDSEQQRFISKDAKVGYDRDGQSLNRYIYAVNNPVKLIDKSGFSASEGLVNTSKDGSSDQLHEYIINEILPTYPNSTPATMLSDSEVEDDGTYLNFIYGHVSITTMIDGKEETTGFGPSTINPFFNEGYIHQDKKNKYLIWEVSVDPEEVRKNIQQSIIDVPKYNAFGWFGETSNCWGWAINMLQN